MKFALIPVDGTRPVEILDDKLELADLQRRVGGYIERVTHGPKELDLWFNEEGKLKGLPINRLATMIAQHGSAIWPQDWISGECIVTGTDDENGDHRPLTEEQAAWLLQLDSTVRRLAAQESTITINITNQTGPQ